MARGALRGSYSRRIRSARAKSRFTLHATEVGVANKRFLAVDSLKEWPAREEAASIFWAHCVVAFIRTRGNGYCANCIKSHVDSISDDTAWTQGQMARGAPFVGSSHPPTVSASGGEAGSTPIWEAIARDTRVEARKKNRCHRDWMRYTVTRLRRAQSNYGFFSEQHGYNRAKRRDVHGMAISEYPYVITRPEGRQ